MSLDESVANIEAVPREDTSRGIAVAKSEEAKYHGRLNMKGVRENTSSEQLPNIPDVSSIMEAMQNGERARMGDKPSDVGYGINNGYGALNPNAGSQTTSGANGSISKDDDDDREI